MHKSGRNDSLSPGASVKTLREYIEQKQDAPAKKKMTFEEWYFQRIGISLTEAKEYKVYDLQVLEDCWNAAQENK